MTNEQYYNLIIRELSKNIDLSIKDFNEVYNVPKQFIKYILPRDYKMNFKDLKRNIVPNKTAFENFANKNPFASINDFLHNFNANIRHEIIKYYENIGLNMTDYFAKKRKEIKSYYIENTSVCNELIADRFNISEHALLKVLRMELVPIRYEHNSKYTKYLADKLLPKGKLQGDVITDSDISDKNGFFCVVKHAKLMLLY